MGIRDMGPFGNDAAADFADALDDPESGAGEAQIRGVLVRTVITTGCLGEADEAVSAAALVAAQCPGGEPAVDTPYNPETPMPVFPCDLRTLADEALARIAGDEAGLASKRVDPEDWKRWQATLTRLRAVLVPPSPSIALFDVQPQRSVTCTEIDSEPEKRTVYVHDFERRSISRGRASRLHTRTNRALSKLHVLTHSCRKINTDKPIQLDRSTRADVLNREVGREARGARRRCRHLRFSREDLPTGSRVCDLIRGGDLEHHPQRPTPLDQPKLRPAGGAVAEPRASDPADPLTVRGHTNKEK
ncbi:DUF4259 domain-containing protein [Streptomyces fagopyri]|uniref:DUF4259 domain-containing protein n=1 Tax=Streptomyces fagopyri TaxID=2662397 RepID=A0A5Q0L6D0_9ACTN|nr:DUF4259 domain-containing protein [Streptomyces fagopyri]